MTATVGSGRERQRVLGQVVASSRPLSWVNTAYPFGAAYLLAGGGVDLTLVLGVLYFLVPYNLLMYGVNDVFDYESDVRNPRKGGVEGVVLDRAVHRTTILAAAVTNLPFLVALVVLGSPASSAVLAVVVISVTMRGAGALSWDFFTAPQALFGLTLGGAALAAWFLLPMFWYLPTVWASDARFMWATPAFADGNRLTVDLPPAPVRSCAPSRS